MVKRLGEIMDTNKMMELYNLASEQRKLSYSPYSGYAVGAALVGKSGKIYTGCNIENSAFSPTVCAERTAFFKAISEGETEFEAIAIAGGFAGKEPVDCMPCGVCRQVMAEFCEGDFIVIGRYGGEVQEMKLSEVFPFEFSAESLEK